MLPAVVLLVESTTGTILVEPIAAFVTVGSCEIFVFAIFHLILIAF